MKRAIFAVLTVVMMAMFVSCLQNNGDIRPWFGQWKVTKIEKNGTVDTEYTGNGILRFQSEVIAVGKVYPNQGGVNLSTGNWKEVTVSSDGSSTTFLNFEFKEGSSVGYQNLYLAKDCVLRVVKRDGRDKILEYTDDNGDKYTYYLKKW